MIRKLMSRNHSAENDMGGDKRNNEIQRIETFSDGVFAFAVTLLIVSLEVPKSFEELMVNVKGFYAFGISFFLLAFIWTEQHKFFRRYGMDDNLTQALNLILLFVVLFFVYPLKFLFTLLFSQKIYGSESPLRITERQGPLLMEVYAVGYIVIYSLFLLMYLRALTCAERLKLNHVEIFDCKTSLYKQMVMVAVGCISLTTAIILPARYLWVSGMSYGLIGIGLTLLLTIRGSARSAIRH